METLLENGHWHLDSPIDEPGTTNSYATLGDVLPKLGHDLLMVAMANWKLIFTLGNLGHYEGAWNTLQKYMAVDQLANKAALLAQQVKAFPANHQLEYINDNTLHVAMLELMVEVTQAKLGFAVYPCSADAPSVPVTSD